MKRYFLSVLAFFSIIALMAACTRYSVSTNAFVDSQAIPQGFPLGSTFAILPPQEVNPLFAKEIVGKISKILDSRGYYTDSFEKADYYLIFDFGMNSKTTTVHVPVYTPGATQTTKGSVCGNYGGYAHYNQTTQSSGTTTYVPKELTLFIRNLSISVYDASLYRNDQTEALVWFGSSVSSGENSDLRYVIDYLLVTTFKTFGINTKKCVTTEIRENNKNVQWLRGEIEDLEEYQESRSKNIKLMRSQCCSESQ